VNAAERRCLSLGRRLDKGLPIIGMGAANNALLCLWYTASDADRAEIEAMGDDPLPTGDPHGHGIVAVKP
jgi:hypothetical protein